VGTGKCVVVPLVFPPPALRSGKNRWNSLSSYPVPAKWVRRWTSWRAGNTNFNLNEVQAVDRGKAKLGTPKVDRGYNERWKAFWGYNVRRWAVCTSWHKVDKGYVKRSGGKGVKQSYYSLFTCCTLY
jgi:hypothetical protein